MIRKKMIALAVCAAIVAHETRAQSYIPELNDTRFKVKPAVSLQVYGFNLSDVKLLPGSPFYAARNADMGYLLALEPDRLLTRFYENAKLPVRAKQYGGWEAEGLSGHTMGHYLSAISMMYASTGNVELKKRADYLVSELARCQAARNTGYVGAIPNEDSIFGQVAHGKIRSGGFDLNGGWSPWYTVHKVMAGLVDAYLYTRNQQALAVVKWMSDWVGNTIGGLSDEQLQRMFKCEWGGMNDVLVMIYAITGESRYNVLAGKFFDDFVMKPLSERKDALSHKHSNTNIPKGVGAANQYIYTGIARDSIMAQYMWRTIVNHYTYANGGNGNYEYFGSPDTLNNTLSDDNSETCATYNMLKLTSGIFTWNPSPSLADYYEKALFNGILGSQNRATGMFCYFVPLRMGGEKAYSDSFHTFTCCVGTGMENHTKYTQAIYFQSPDSKSLYVNLFIPSELNWKEQKAKVRILSSIIDSDTIQFGISTAAKTGFALKLRKPFWSETYTVLVNGKKIASSLSKDGYVIVNRIWENGDKVSYILKKYLRSEHLPDNDKRLAVYYGPILLAGQLGDTMPDAVDGIPVILSENNNVSEWITPVNTKDLLFRTTQSSQPLQVNVQPFYVTDQGHYNVYWDKFNNQEWAQKRVEYIAAQKREKEIESRTLDLFRIGEMQPERDHNFASTGNSYVSESFGKHGREARSGGSLKFSMNVDPVQQNSLLINYIGADKGRRFDILVDGQLLITETTRTDFAEDKFYDKEYKLPMEVTKGKSRVTVLITANHGATAGRVFEIRMIKTINN